jgi:hypothetical protein
LVLRYDSTATEDDPPPGEGAFLLCSFWLADAHIQIGRAADAQFAPLVTAYRRLGLEGEPLAPGLIRDDESGVDQHGRFMRNELATKG